MLSGPPLGRQTYPRDPPQWSARRGRVGFSARLDFVPRRRSMGGQAVAGGHRVSAARIHFVTPTRLAGAEQGGALERLPANCHPVLLSPLFPAGAARCALRWLEERCRGQRRAEEGCLGVPRYEGRGARREECLSGAAACGAVRRGTPARPGPLCPAERGRNVRYCHEIINK